MLREAYDAYLTPMAEKWAREHCLRVARQAVVNSAAATMKEWLTAGPYNFESPRLVSCVLGDELVRPMVLSLAAVVVSSTNAVWCGVWVVVVMVVSELLRCTEQAG